MSDSLRINNPYHKTIGHLDQMMEKFHDQEELLTDLQELKETLFQSNGVDSEQNRQDFERYFFHAPYGIFIINEKAEFVNANSTAADQLGYSIEELLSMTIKDVAPPKSLHLSMALFKKLLKDGYAIGEAPARKKNGEEIYLSLNATKISDNEFIGFTSDISEKRRMEQVLKESESKNRALIEVTSESIFFTYKGYIIECNPAACTMSGYSYKEIIGKFATFMGTEESKEIIKNNMFSDRKTAYEVPLLRKDGSMFWAEIQGKNYVYEGKSIRVASIRDISAKKGYENRLERTISELKDSEGKNRALSRAANEAIFFTEKGVLIECNQMACRIFGYTYEEIIGMHAIQLCAPETREMVRNYILEGYEDPYESKVLRKDGTIFDVIVEGKMFPYRGKTVRVTTVRDITTQKLAEQELREKDEKLKLYADNTQDVIWTLDNQLNYVYISPSIEQLQGYTADEVIGRSVKDMITEETYEKSLQILAGLKKGVDEGSTGIQAIKTDATLVHKNGDHILVEIHANYIVDKNKNTAYITGVSRDITQKRKDEEKLQQASDIFQNILSGIHLYHMEDLNDDRSLRLIAANPASTEITGLNTEEVLGKRIDEIFPLSRKLGITEQYAEVIRTKTPRILEEIEYEEDLKDPLVLSIKAFPLPNNCMASSFESISKLKQTQSELQVRNSELNNFVYKVSHDLRAPLASIKGLLHLAGFEMGQNEYLKRIEDSIQKLDNFIRNVLSHSRNLNTAPIVDKIDLKLLVDQCFSELSYLPGIKEIDKKVRISGTEYSNDSVRIFEIFRNLISNAVKYRDLEKESSFVHIEVKTDPKKVKITISDNGIGIENDHLKGIFDMFYRATETSDGSGIGLYIVNQAVKKLNGKIRVESKLNEGTKFIIELPNLSK